MTPLKISLLPALLILFQSVFAQVQISGRVTDHENQTIPFATILEVGTNNGTTTDLDGNYKITIRNEQATLRFSMMGFLAESVPVDGRSIINVQLFPDIIFMSEVVVVGYGTTRKEDLTSAIAVIDKAEIAKVPVISFEQALQGKSAGVNVVQSGAPGGQANVIIRGIGSVNGAAPLYVVDGIIGAAPPSPDDIESIQVLKDAASSAIYGSRGANGVIIITTKKGQKGETRVTLKSVLGWQQVTNRIDMMDANQFIEYWNRNREINQITDQNGIRLFPNGADISMPGRVSHAISDPDNYFYNTNWQDEIYKMGVFRTINGSVSSGNENGTYFLSVDNRNNEGIQIGSGFSQTSVQLNTEYKKGIVTVGENLNVRFRDSKDNGSRLRLALRQTPLLPVYNPVASGEFDKWAGNSELDNSNNGNPVADIRGIARENTTEAIYGTFFAQLELHDNLNFRANYNILMHQDESFTTNFPRQEGTAGPKITKTTINHNSSRSIDQQLEAILTFSKKWNNHNVTAMAGYTQEESRARGLNGFADNFSVGNPGSLDARLDDANMNVGGYYSERALQSGLARLMYDYKSRYLFTANVRTDGTSAFQQSRRWSTFPSVSAGWRMSEEQFLKNVTWLDDFKARVGYGTIGSQILPGNVSNNTLSLLPSATYVFNNREATGITLNQIIDETLTWETTTTFNAGIDAEAFNNRLTFIADYYININNGMILPVPLPYSSGLGFSRSFMNTNAGSLTNAGWEFGATFREALRDLKYQISGSLSFENNTVTDLGGGDFLVGGKTQYYSEGLTRTIVGRSLADFYGYVFDGIYQIGDTDIPASRQPGDVRYRDLDGDGQISDQDKTFLGSSLPKYYGSFNINLEFKNWDLSMFFYGVQGNKIFNHNRYHTEILAKGFNQSTVVLDAWTPDNPSTTMPRFTDQHTDNYAKPSDRFLEDGSYVRLQNLVLGYNLPKRWLDPIHINSCRVYGTVQNLLTLTNYSGMDPEIYSATASWQTMPVLDRGIDDSKYPISRTIVFGVEVSF